jgi:hypothetical protein
MEILVNRTWTVPDNSQYRATTTGTVSIDGSQVCFSLEPTALMIPAGSYPVKLAMSHRFSRMTPHLDVPGRTFIEIHGGNTATDSEGCVLIGEKRLSDYMIVESAPATSAIENMLMQAEDNNEVNTVVIV